MNIVVKKEPPLLGDSRLPIPFVKDVLTVLNHLVMSKTVRWEGSYCQILDQTKLPSLECYLQCQNYREVIAAIQNLSVRGAPAIGVAAAYAVVLAAKEGASNVEPAAWMEKAFQEILHSRPTAVNLARALQRMESIWLQNPTLNSNSIEALLVQAKQIAEEEERASQLMADFGVSLLREKSKVLTICNTGELATCGTGTALGVILRGVSLGKVEHVYALETRPLLQGLRLTAWELQSKKVPFTVLCDSMIGSIMSKTNIDAVMVGADRIALNGDTANKVGTFTLAVLSNYFQIPFIVVAPSSTIDPSLPNGKTIPIEHRHPSEVLSILGQNQHALPPTVYNPAFDVTPANLIRGIVTEKGVFEFPFHRLSEVL